MIPTEFLRRMIKPSLYGNIKRLEADYIEDICTSIKQHGILEPLIVSLDDQGKMCLRDGHHRVVCADLLAIEELPVRLERSQGVAKHNIPQRDLIDLLWSMVG